MQEKIAKICWNDYNWVKPSGTNGKSNSTESYENSQGYGHEEWLFDIDKTIDGLHYAFLQPLNLKTDLHVNKVYKIWLYTVRKKEKILLGFINNVVCISKTESDEIYKIYKKNGWLKKMTEDLKEAGINPKNFKNTSSNIFFNLKFESNSYELFDDPKTISEIDKNISTTRYKLLDKKSEFVFNSIHQKNTEPFFRKAVEGTVINPYHNKIQNILAKKLLESGKYKNIRLENCNVDVTATFVKDNKEHYFEIKTANVKNNIRDALGQLLEYAFYPDKFKATKLFIVGKEKPNIEEQLYLKHIRSITSLKVFYLWVEMETETISGEY